MNLTELLLLSYHFDNCALSYEAIRFVILCNPSPSSRNILVSEGVL